MENVEHNFVIKNGKLSGEQVFPEEYSCKTSNSALSLLVDDDATDAYQGELENIQICFIHGIEI